MKVTLAVDPAFVGVIEEEIPGVGNVEPFMREVERVVSLFRDEDKIVITESVVNIINVECTNLLLGRACKKTAGEIAEIIRNMN